jgi:hypothetical protein
MSVFSKRAKQTKRIRRIRKLNARMFTREAQYHKRINRRKQSLKDKRRYYGFGNFGIDTNNIWHRTLHKYGRTVTLRVVALCKTKYIIVRKHLESGNWCPKCFTLQDKMVFAIGQKLEDKGNLYETSPFGVVV